MAPLIPAFRIRLNNPILHGLATVGQYDGKHPSLTCATSAGKIFIHSPHQSDAEADWEIRFLNINRKITALASGRLNPNLPRDVLVVGTQTNLLAFDVEKNSDLFYKDVPDGINAVAFGHIGSSENPLAIVGGNCSIQGFDFEGNELFWTVTGDNVTSLTLCDVNDDSQNELLVGSEDFEIRIFQNEEVVAECTETDKVVGLCHVRGSRYGYALGNGTVGVYDKTSRAWRVKSRNQVMAIHAHDLDADGIPELISGWSNGKFEVRNEKNGEVVYKDHFSTPVSAIIEADYRLDGRVEVIACGSDGEVRGYLPAEGEQIGNLMDSTTEEDNIAELIQRKQELLYELKTYEDGVKATASGTATPIIPPETAVSCQWCVNQEEKCVELAISINTDAVIKGVLIFAEQLFESSESRFIHPKTPSKALRIPISSPRDISTDLFLKVMVGQRNAATYHVFENSYKLPKFSMYLPCTEGSVAEPKSSVTFFINERVNRVVMWMNNSFNIQYEHYGTENLSVAFTSLRDGRPLFIRMTQKGSSQVSILTDDMEVAGELVQDMCAYLTITEQESIAEFPLEMAEFRNVLQKVDEFNATRLKLTAEMADTSNVVKTLVIKAEDARILNEMKLMKRMYTDLFDLNRELIGEHTKRTNNHQELLASLKLVNQMIQKAARLRVGNAKTRVVSACRNAIKTNNIHALFKIIQTGAEK